MPSRSPGEFHFPLIDAVASRDVESVFVKGAVVNAAIFDRWPREDELHATWLVKDLKTSSRADKQVTRRGAALAIQGIGLSIARTMSMEVRLFVAESAIRAQGVGVDKWSVELADVELGLIRAHPNPIEPFQTISELALSGL